MQKPKIEEATITIVTEPDVVTLLQIAINHLAMSIDDGSFDLHGANEDAIMANLFELNNYMDNILSNFS